jgi:tetratricopeptide (TPR) repeat protein
MFEAIGHLHLAETYFLLREYPKSKAHYENVITIGKNESYLPSIVGWCEINLIKSKIMNNDIIIDFEPLYRKANEIKLNPVKSQAFRSLCAILLSTNEHLSEAEEWITKAIEINKKYGMRLYLAIDYAQYSELFIKKGDQSKAKENLNKAIEIFKQCGADGWVEKYEKELASLS